MRRIAAAVFLCLAACSSRPATDSGPLPGPQWVAAGAGALDAVVRAEAERAARSGGRLVVYVGASWCEPCRHFKAAVDDGQLDDALRGVVLLELDADRDEARLEAAGYGGRLIPRFVLPRPDGRASERRFEGSVKGPAAVGDLRPKLQWLLE